jgi:hypothetical protein
MDGLREVFLLLLPLRLVGMTEVEGVGWGGEERRMEDLRMGRPEVGEFVREGETTKTSEALSEERASTAVQAYVPIQT